MTIMYGGPAQHTKPPARACEGRCSKCIQDLMADSVGPPNFWYRLLLLRVARCRYCYRTGCAAAYACSRTCDAGPDDYPEPPNRTDHRILDTPPMTPPPADR